MRITLEQAVRAAEEVVAAQPEGHRDVGPIHHYFEVNGKPSCLVGYLLAKWGVGLQDMLGSLNGCGIHTLMHHKIITVDDPRARHFLTHLQLGNDAGKEWATVLKLAKEMVGWVEPKPLRKKVKAAFTRKGEDKPTAPLMEITVFPTGDITGPSKTLTVPQEWVAAYNKDETKIPVSV